MAPRMRWIKLWKFNPLGRTLHYVRTLANRIEIEGEDHAKVQRLLRLLAGRATRIRVLVASRLFFQILLYASVASAIAVKIFDIPLVSRLSDPIVKFSLLVGTPISLFYVVLFTKIIDLYYEDVRVLVAHILALLTKHDTSPDFEPFLEEIS
jgi:hypothetical protein